jgi:hypothetical protein
VVTPVAHDDAFVPDDECAEPADQHEERRKSPHELEPVAPTRQQCRTELAGHSDDEQLRRLRLRLLRSTALQDLDGDRCSDERDPHSVGLPVQHSQCGRQHSHGCPAA